MFDFITYRLTVLPQPTDDGPLEADGGGFMYFDMHFDADPDTLMGVALDQVGVFDPDHFSIESNAEVGWTVRDPDGEPFLSLEPCPDEVESSDAETEYCEWGVFT